jgi:protein-S-isoprenylcysteine O-methyltransferase Ste14
MFLNSTTVKVVPSSKSAVGDLKVSKGDASNFAPPILVLVVLLLLIVAALVLRARRRRNTPAVVTAVPREREHQLT